MEKSLFKVFFSKTKECEWLCELGKKGYLLTSINDSKYKFEINEEKQYYYSIEYLDYSPHSEEASEYYLSRRGEGTIPVLSSKNWVYFVNSEKEIEMNSEIYRKNSIYYFWRMLYFSFFALLGGVLCGYQAFAVGFLKRIGYVGNGQIREMLEITDKGTTFEGLLNAFKRLINFILELVNKYIKLWTNAFGESDAIAVIAIAVPITLIVLCFLTHNINEFYTHKKLQKQFKKASAKPLDSNTTVNEVESDAEQAI